MAACALATSGCTSWSQYWRNNMMVGPAYLRPPAPVENEWIDAGDPQVRSMSDVESLWWEQFDEPVLNGLVLQAYEGNLSLREAGFRVERVVTIVDRQEGGQEAMQAAGLEMRSLFLLAEVAALAAELATS